jgi:glycosyltransferase involved in cell wall biosynthesis
MTNYGFLSTYPPTQCGLATFSTALGAHLRTGHDQVAVVSAVDAYSPDAPAEVRYQWVRDRFDQVGPAAEVLNQTDVVVVQHEYGIFGGTDGDQLLEVLSRVRVPIIATLHTVLTDPSPHQREILEDLAAQASTVVTMTRAARDRLVGGYRIDPSVVKVVPHGAPDRWPTFDRSEPRPWRMLTWGLIGPGKGIEWGIEAMAHLTDLDLVYEVVGETHPKVAAASGEAYRHHLMDLARQHGVADRVVFRGQYLDANHLRQVVVSADLVLLPYESRDQVTSGVLVEAVAAGRAVVSTDFPHARELLGAGNGLLVPPRNPEAIAAAVRRAVSEPGVAAALQRRARRLAPSLSWTAVGEAYRRLAAQAVSGRAIAS